MLIRLLSKKFGLLNHGEKYKKSIHNYEKLDKAIDGFLFATSKDEILALLK
ncbi:MAG: hypothetical protein SVR08_15145 [Spirochaetota bacterium]|nr:hypothetical protein [Spirochaetota bacterium]